MTTSSGSSDLAITDEIHRVAEIVGGEPTKSEFKELGRISMYQVKKEHGSWSNAKQAAGFNGDLRSETTDAIPPEALFADLRNVFRQNRDVPDSPLMRAKPLTKSEYQTDGEYSPDSCIRRAGSWRAANAEAGLPVNGPNGEIPMSVLLDELRRLYNVLDREPTTEDLRTHGRYSRRPYDRAFDSFPAAKQRALGPDALDPDPVFSDSALLAEVRRIRADAGPEPTPATVREYGSIPVEALTEQFGSVQAAASAAGVADLPTSPDYSDAELCTIVSRVAESCDGNMSESEINADGEVAARTLRRRFGSITNACYAAGVDGAVVTPPYAVSDLLTEIRRVRDDPRETTQKDLVDEGNVAPTTVQYHIGSWRAATSLAARI